MRRFIRPLLITLGVVVALLAAVIIAVVVLVEPDEYRDTIAATVQERTGRELAIEGALDLDLLPCCSLAVGPTALGNPPGFPAEPFVRVDSARLFIRIWPLLTRREIRIGDVVVEGLRANLLRRADGQANWTFDTGEEPDETPAQQTGGLPEDFAIAGLVVRDGALTWRDEVAGSGYRLADLEVETGAIRENAPFSFETSFGFADLVEGGTGTLALRGRGRLQPGAERIHLEGPAGELSVTPPAEPAEPDTADGQQAPQQRAVIDLQFTAGAVDVDLAGETAAVTSLTTEIGATGIGPGRITGTLGAAAVDVAFADATRLTLPAADVDLTLAGEELPGGSAVVKARVEAVELDTGAMAGNVGSLEGTLSISGAALTLRGHGSFGDRNALSGTLGVEPLSPRDLLRALGQPVPQTADPKALTRLSGASGWFLRGEQAGLERMDLRLDDTHVTGSVATGLGDAAVSRFDLNLDSLVLDRYLAPEAEPGPQGGDSPAPPSPPTELPLDMLKNLRLEGRAKLGRLVWEGLQLADVMVTARAADGRLRLEPLSAGLYGGRYNGGITIDATEPRARVSFTQEFTGVALGPLLGDFTDVDNIAGTMVARLNGAATGNDDQALLRSLSGDVAFSLADGVWRGLDLWYEIRRARALIRRDAPPPRQGAPETPIQALELAGRIAEGTLHSDKLVAEVPFLRLSGDVALNLLQKSVEADLQALVFEKPVFPDGTDLEDLTNARLPLTISGRLEAPKVRVDLAQMVRGAVRDTLKEAVREKSGRLLERLGIGGEPAPAPESGQAPAESPETAPPAEEEPGQEDPAQQESGDTVRKALDRLLGR